MKPEKDQLFRQLTWGREVVKCVCGGQRAKEGDREVTCLGYRHAKEDTSKNSKGNLEQERKAYMDLHDTVENPSRESLKEASYEPSGSR